MSYLTAYNTILRKEVLRFTRIWVQTIFPPVITTSLYLLIFGGIMGSRIGDMSGISYVRYIVPGVILMTIITNSYMNTVSSFFLAKFNHSIEELLVSPTPNWVILLGFISGGVARGLAVGFTVSIVAWAFVRFSIYSLSITLLTTIMTSILFSLMGFINAVFAKTFDDISIIPSFILMPLVYLGGMFYSIEILPEFWRNISQFNPIFYMVDSFRFGFLGVSSSPVYESLLFILLAIILLGIVSLKLLKNGVNIRF